MTTDIERRPVWQAIWRGMRQRCPNCGMGRLYRRYLKVADQCGSCGEALHLHRADDAPAYFTMAIVGHIVVGLALWLEVTQAPKMWIHAALWLPLCLALSLALLPRCKSVIVSLQWALRMHGFDENSEISDV